jgi:hypothetical protein
VTNQRLKQNNCSNGGSACDLLQQPVAVS